MNHCMIDLETLSLQPDAHIVSIAAVWFDQRKGFGHELLIHIDPTENNGAIDAATVAWWAQQSPKAQEAAFYPRGESMRLPGALRVLNNFIEANYDIQTPKLWSRGYMDPAWLESAYKRKGIPPEFNYGWWNDQRTITNLANIDYDAYEVGHVAHNPLDDCRVQIHQLIAAAELLGIEL